MARNLIRIFDELNKTYFDGKVYAGIGWRKWPIGAEEVTLASCTTSERFIRISTLLKDKHIPRWFLKYVVYHEMIHALQGPKANPHNSWFQKKEKQYPDYKRAIEFEVTKLPKILDRLRKSP